AGSVLARELEVVRQLSAQTGDRAHSAARQTLGQRALRGGGRVFCGFGIARGGIRSERADVRRDVVILLVRHGVTGGERTEERGERSDCDSMHASVGISKAWTASTKGAFPPGRPRSIPRWIAADENDDPSQDHPGANRNG